MQAQTEAEVVELLGPAVFECRQKDLLARKYAQGTLSWKDDLIPAILGLFLTGLLIAYTISEGRPITLTTVVTHAILIPVFFLPFIILAIRSRQMRRLAIHDRGLRFHWSVIPFSEIEKIEPVHPSAKRKSQLTVAYALSLMGGRAATGLAAHGQLHNEFNKAFDIVPKEGSPIRCRYVTYHFEDGDVDQVMQRLSAAHPTFFMTRELNNLFSEMSGRDNPAVSFNNFGQE